MSTEHSHCLNDSRSSTHIALRVWRYSNVHPRVHNGAPLDPIRQWALTNLLPDDAQGLLKRARV